MNDNTRSAIVEDELKQIDAPNKIPCGYKDCYCFVNEEQKFCSSKCEEYNREQPEDMHGDCDCEHADCVMIPGRDSASIFAQRSLN